MYQTDIKWITSYINSKNFIILISNLYHLDIKSDAEKLKYQQQRYRKAIDRFSELFDEKKDIFLISSPGRTEIGGNHTDHNNGLVFSGAVDLDVLVVASKRDDNIVNLYSEQFQKKFLLSAGDLNKRDDEAGTSTSLIRGILKGIKNRDFRVGGFNAYLTSDIPEGSGLSSSAAFEVAVTETLNQLYNNGKINKTEIAKISRYAENVYFEKPCGLMDQLTSCYGGLLQIDFRDIDNPEIKKVNYDFSKIDYMLCVVNTGSSHSNLTDEYSSIKRDMESVANYFNLQSCRGINYTDFINKLPELRKLCGDRAVLRVFHFLNENRRVIEQVKALENEDFQYFIELFQESGNSSFKWLQNIYSCKDVEHQGITIALSIAENIYPRSAFARVHGGGFAGTIQIFVKKNAYRDLSNSYRSIFGENSIYSIKIRNTGSILVNSFLKSL